MVGRASLIESHQGEDLEGVSDLRSPYSMGCPPPIALPNGWDSGSDRVTKFDICALLGGGELCPITVRGQVIRHLPTVLSHAERRELHDYKRRRNSLFFCVLYGMNTRSDGHRCRPGEGPVPLVQPCAAAGCGPRYQGTAMSTSAHARSAY